MGETDVRHICCESFQLKFQNHIWSSTQSWLQVRARCNCGGNIWFLMMLFETCSRWVFCPHALRLERLTSVNVASLFFGRVANTFLVFSILAFLTSSVCGACFTRPQHNCFVDVSHEFGIQGTINWTTLHEETDVNMRHVDAFSCSMCFTVSLMND